MENTRSTLGSWLIPLTEEELLDWISSPKYTLPRLGVPVLQMDSFRQVGIAHVSDSKDDWLLAAYRTENGNPRNGVPFSEVTCLLGMTSRKLALLENHYGGLGPKIEAAAPDQGASFDAWWLRSRIETLAVDCEAGANALAELMGIGRRVKRSYGRKVAEILIADEMGQSQTSRPYCLFAYSRSFESGLSLLGSAFCDLGHTLRLCLKDKQSGMVSALARRIGELFAKGGDLIQHDIDGLMKEFKSIKEFRLRYVLFLKWKYAAEQNGGAIDFQEMLDDAAWFRECSELQVEFEAGALLYGAFAGFKSFAVQYHLRKRDLRR